MITLVILLFIINIFFLFFFKKISILIGLFDIPDGKRKKHLISTPAMGGVLLYFNLIFFFLFKIFNNFYFAEESVLIFFFFSSLFFGIGFIDDKYNLKPNTKIILFSLFIYILLYLDNNLLINNLKFSFIEKTLNLQIFSTLFTILSFLLFLNAFNMFDGINLQSSIYSFFIFSIFILKGIYIELSLVVFIFLIHFIYLNYNNKCFLGDNGTLLISFIISYIFLKSTNVQNTFNADEIFLIMLIPGLDLLRLAIFRISIKKNPFSPDRNHIHHLLVNRFGLYNSLSILFFFIIIPNLISLFYGWTFYLIVLFSLLYFLLIFLLKK